MRLENTHSHFLTFGFPRPIKLPVMFWRLRVCLMLAALLAGAAPRVVWAACCSPAPLRVCHMAPSHCMMAKGRACCHKGNGVALSAAPVALCLPPQTWKAVDETNPRADAIVVGAFAWPHALLENEAPRYANSSFAWISGRRRSVSCRAPPIDSSVTPQEGG